MLIKLFPLQKAQYITLEPLAHGRMAHLFVELQPATRNARHCLAEQCLGINGLVQAGNDRGGCRNL